MQTKFHSLQIFSILDKAGATVPWVCAVHCLLMPIAVSFLPMFGLSFLAEEGFEVLFIGLSFLAAVFSLLPGYIRHHRRLQIPILFSFGITLVVIAEMLFENNAFLKMFLILTGATLISGSHILNRRFCRECLVCEKSEATR